LAGLSGQRGGLYIGRLQVAPDGAAAAPPATRLIVLLVVVLLLIVLGAGS